MALAGLLPGLSSWWIRGDPFAAAPLAWSDALDRAVPARPRPLLAEPLMLPAGARGVLVLRPEATGWLSAPHLPRAGPSAARTAGPIGAARAQAQTGAPAPVVKEATPPPTGNVLLPEPEVPGPRLDGEERSDGVVAPLPEAPSPIAPGRVVKSGADPPHMLGVCCAPPLLPAGAEDAGLPPAFCVAASGGLARRLSAKARIARFAD